MLWGVFPVPVDLINEPNNPLTDLNNRSVVVLCVRQVKDGSLI